MTVTTTYVPSFGDDIQNPVYGYQSLGVLSSVHVEKSPLCKVYTFSMSGEKDGRVLELPNTMCKDCNIVDGGSVCGGKIINWIARTLKVDVIENLFQAILCVT